MKAGLPDGWRHAIARQLRRPGAALAAALLAVCLLTALVEPRFLSQSNLRSVLLWCPLLAVVCVGQTLVVLARGIDISVGASMGLAGLCVGLLFREHAIENVYAGAALAMLLGAALGAVNGGLIAAAGLPPIVATLGTMGAYRGLVHVVSGGEQINAYELPRTLDRWSIEGPFGQTLVPWIVVLAVVVATAASLALSHTRWGRDVYAIGGNPQAARLRGIPVRRITFGVYTLSGAMAGLAGVLYASRFGAINPASIGVGFELASVSAVVVGGVSIFGGAGQLPHVLLACLLLGTINTSLAVLGLPDAWQGTLYGLLIVLAVAADSLSRRWGQRGQP